MINNQTNYLMQSFLNGAFHKDNFVWGGAMNICWQTLETDVLKEPLLLQVKGELAQAMVNNFQKPIFTKKDLSEDSYYTKAGYGQQALDTINTECKKKFPKKSFKDLDLKLLPTDIISYAYFVKEVQYLNPFAIKPKFTFMKKVVKGFKAKEGIHFDNIRLCKYSNDSEFVLKLLLKQKNEELFIVKGFEKSLPQDVVALVQQHGNVSEKLGNDEVFEMPVIELDVKREYKQLIGSACKNQSLPNYRLSAMFQNIKFKIDEVGAKVENQAVMVLSKCMVVKPVIKRNLIVNQPFWVVMKQKEGYPYFVAQINNTDFMSESK